MNHSVACGGGAGRGFGKGVEGVGVAVGWDTAGKQVVVTGTRRCLLERAAYTLAHAGAVTVAALRL
jgi:hypothetical protein